MKVALHHRVSAMTITTTAVVWALAIASIGYWSSPWLHDDSAVSQERGADSTEPSSVDVAAVAAGLAGKGLGESSEAPASANEDLPVLVGIAADAQGGGVALLTSEGQSAIPVRVGDTYQGKWTLHSVKDREAVLVTQGGVRTFRTLAVTERR